MNFNFDVLVPHGRCNDRINAHDDDDDDWIIHVVGKTLLPIGVATWHIGGEIRIADSVQ